MLERLDKLLEEQQSAREKIASEIHDVEESIREKLTRVNSWLEELLRNPPWAEGKTPTRVETEEKIRGFVGEIAKLAKKSAAQDVLPQEALQQAEQWVLELVRANLEELEKGLKDGQYKVNTLRGLLQIIQQAKGTQTEVQGRIEQLKRELDSICSGQTIEEIKARFDQLNEQLRKANAKLAIAREAEVYCRTHSATECPVCQAGYAADDLMGKMRHVIEQAAPQQKALAEKCNDLQGRFKRASELHGEFQELTTQVQKAQKAQHDAISQAGSLLGISDESLLNEQTLTSHLNALEESVKTLENSLRATEFRAAELRKRIDELQREARFHQLRDEQQRLQDQLTLELEPTRESFKELVSLEDTMLKIKSVLEQAFNDAIDNAIPHLNNMMTEVYQRLTGPQSFEKIYIKREQSPAGRRLQVYAGSDRVPGQFFYPEDVLNGQALSALRLVPYFVFSQFQAEALELDLLLIDDPSQSFDTSHINSLLQELANAGLHAQLIVATHEDERFGPQISEHFSKDEYEVIRVTGFDLGRGPSFAIER